eukprot:TRINITY_DN18422_c0_g1_i1.p2 TRINITY_DN18422_c0_g1~~TRINITY_DN18422_c0_g1_i1.p2  ORF type:complete len:126 (-),score=2.81 TRINITY_DN18422_c0_g1_i1:311-688(-)
MEDLGDWNKPTTNARFRWFNEVTEQGVLFMARPKLASFITALVKLVERTYDDEQQQLAVIQQWQTWRSTAPQGIPQCRRVAVRGGGGGGRCSAGITHHPPAGSRAPGAADVGVPLGEAGRPTAAL